MTHVSDRAWQDRYADHLHDLNQRRYPPLQVVGTGPLSMWLPAGEPDGGTEHGRGHGDGQESS